MESFDLICDRFNLFRTWIMGKQTCQVESNVSMQGRYHDYSLEQVR